MNSNSQPPPGAGPNNNSNSIPPSAGNEAQQHIDDQTQPSNEIKPELNPENIPNPANYPFPNYRLELRGKSNFCLKTQKRLTKFWLYAQTGYPQASLNNTLNGISYNNANPGLINSNDYTNQYSKQFELF